MPNGCLDGTNTNNLKTHISGYMDSKKLKIVRLACINYFLRHISHHGTLCCLSHLLVLSNSTSDSGGGVSGVFE